MIPAVEVIQFADVSKTAGATYTAMVDRLGYEAVVFALREATADVVSNKPTVLKITESDTTNLTDAAAIVEFTGGTQTSTSVGFVIASANTSATSMTQFNIDCRGRKRYLFLSVSPATTQINGAVAVLMRGSQNPINATVAGIKQMIEG